MLPRAVCLSALLLLELLVTTLSPLCLRTSRHAVNMLNELVNVHLDKMFSLSLRFSFFMCQNGDGKTCVVGSGKSIEVKLNRKCLA